MRTVRLMTVLVVACLALIAAGETFKGELDSRDMAKKTISVKIRTFTVNSATKYLDKDGKESPMLGRAEIAALTKKGLKVTVDAGTDNVAKSVQFELSIMMSGGSGSLKGGGPGMKMVSGDEIRAKLEGKPLPAFSMQSTNGKTLTSSSLKGKVLVLDFWATWCEPCKMLSPTMQSIYGQLGSKGVVVIGANGFEHGDGKALASGYAKEHKYTFPMTYNSQEYAHSMGIFVLPTVLVVDKAGIVRKVFTGYSTQMAQQIEATVKRLAG